MTEVLVVGGGLAGMSAAVALAGDGAQVTVLEGRPEVGGRAYSYEHPALGETVDSQHVVLGCCTNLVELCGQAGTADWVKWYDELTFLEPDGGRSVMRPGGLPAPLHQTMSFLRAGMLGVGDKVEIARGLMEFLRGYPATDEESFATWLRRTGQTERAVRHFWEPVVVGALNDGFERCSTKYAGKVFHETFLKSAKGGRLGIPARPLTEFFGPVRELARRLGAKVEAKARVDVLRERAGGGWTAVTADGREFGAEKVVVATDFRQAQRLLAGRGVLAEEDASAFVAAPITTVHLWHERDVTEMDHAVLLDTRIQWMFCKSRIRGWERGSYIELVISASWEELKQDRETILREAMREAEMFFPAMRETRPVKTGVLKEARATFSVAPGLDRWRPAQETGVTGLYVAGDWTATEWPSTMEGAVRSGRLAAGAVRGRAAEYLAAEVEAEGLMRWLV